VSSYLPIPPTKTKEFWTKWKIEHIRKLAQTGRATSELIPPESERTHRILDQVFLKRSNLSSSSSSAEKVNLAVRFTADSEIVLTSPLYLGDMSFGALSGVPNIAIARAAEKCGIIAGTGEGGLLKEVADCSRITVQWASARFGVDSASLSKGQAVVIKIGQGAKPGIGGHLPGVKVTEPISQTRRIPIGRDAISPAPHHDIYSIEDLGQRILALKEATSKPVLVKIGATNYVPYIACGIARMGASGIIIDGSGAGTGAAPSVVRDNVGIPIEIAVASVDNALKKEGMRDGFTVIAAGRVSTPEDSLKLIALGADIVSLGTAALISLGCIMVHKCHLGYCPAVLTNKISSNQVKILSTEQSIRWLCNLVQGWNEEMKFLLNQMGLQDISALRGRRDLLTCSESINPETAKILGLNPRQQPAADSKIQKQAFFHFGLGGGSQNAGESMWQMWSSRRVNTLREMAGTIGKSAGEAVISSMGTTSPPFVEEPERISDYLVSDGAQVTRPSIDPYREVIETAVFLSGSEIRLSSPFFFTHLPGPVSHSVRAVFARVAASLGLLFDLGQQQCDQAPLNKYTSRLISDYPKGPFLAQSGIVSIPSDYYISEVRAREEVRRLRKSGRIVFLRCSPLFCSPSLSTARAAIEKLCDIANKDDELGNIFSGILLDEDALENMPLEVAVSLLDRELKRRSKRESVSILAESNSIRGSDDVFKLLALGADAVGFGACALLAIGFEGGNNNVVFDSSNSTERLENFILALQKDIKLLAGAAGVSSIGSTLVGNRELLRSVDLDPEIRKLLDVKIAGAL
jgi:glutamate synthase domain-containing protein 2